MTNTKLIIVAVIVIAISVFFSFLLIPGVKTIVNTVTEQIGGSGGDFSTNWFRFGGVEHVASSMAMRTSTGTPCALQAPSATSSLLFASINFNDASSTAVVLVMAKASTAFATTTQIGNTYLTTTAQTDLTLLASTTAADKAGQDDIFEPSYWLVFSMANSGGTGGPYAATAGTCKAEWIVNSR